MWICTAMCEISSAASSHVEASELEHADVTVYHLPCCSNAQKRTPSTKYFGKLAGVFANN